MALSTQGYEIYVKTKNDFLQCSVWCFPQMLAIFRGILASLKDCLDSFVSATPELSMLHLAFRGAKFE